ncbi:MAG: substrate-binding domain-containing protein [Chloroflexota bacterium]
MTTSLAFQITLLTQLGRTGSLIVILMIVLAGCYQTAPTASGPVATPTRVAKPRPPHTVVLDGSAIVGEIMQGVGLGFEGFTPGYTVQVGKVGTLDGFKMLCEDSTDIQMAVRVMSAEEASTCLRNGIDYLQITVGYDVLAVIGKNPLGECVSSSELTYLYGNANLTWHNVRGGLPFDPVTIFAPPPTTAAAQFFAERVLANKPTAATPPDVQQLITGGGDGIGYLPLAVAQKLGGRLPILAVDSGAGCTAPAAESVWDGSYSFLSRPLYLYINRQSVHRSEVFRFLSYALSIPGQTYIGAVGYVVASPKTYQDAQAELDLIVQQG